MERKTVRVIVPCLNHLDYTKETLDALEANTDTSKYDVELVIVDDGSDDDTPTYFTDLNYRTKFDTFTYLRNETNYGFGPAVNKGIREGNKDVTFIAVFNNDVLVGPDWLDYLIEVLEWQPEIGMVSCTIFDTKMDWEAAQMDIDRTDTRVRIWEKNGPWLFKTETFKDVGLFDPQFAPAYYEDDDIMVRMALSGWVFGRVENSVAYHYLGITRKGELEKRNGTAYYNQNFHRFAQKWGLQANKRFAIIYDQTFESDQIKYIQIPTRLLNDYMGMVEISLKDKEVFVADHDAPGFSHIKEPQWT